MKQLRVDLQYLISTGFHHEICRWLLKTKNSEGPELRVLPFTIITQKMSICIRDSWFYVVGLCSTSSRQKALILLYISVVVFGQSYLFAWVPEAKEREMNFSTPEKNSVKSTTRYVDGTEMYPFPEEGFVRGSHFEKFSGRSLDSDNDNM
jgi:hypothetical protein